MEEGDVEEAGGAGGVMAVGEVMAAAWVAVAGGVATTGGVAVAGSWAWAEWQKMARAKRARNRGQFTRGLRSVA